jgi:hypothetical protein
LLIEEGRTNLLARSEEFDATYWTKIRSSVPTPNTAISPSGATDADKLVEDTSSNTHLVYRLVNVGVTTPISFSVFAKASERSWIQLECGDNFTAGSTAYFNLSNGTIGTVGAGATASIQSMGNGWYRCVVVATPTATTSNGFYVNIATANGTRSYAGDGTSGVFLWGAQLEVGSFPTSYIPTTTGTLARSADVCSITTAGWSNAGNDTMVVEYFVERTTNAILVEGGPSISWMTIGVATTNRQRNLYRHGGSSTRVDAQTADNSVSFVSINKTALTSGEQIALNGSLSQTLLGDPPQSDISTILSIGRRSDFGGAAYLNGHIAAIRYYKKRLPNAKIQALTV